MYSISLVKMKGLIHRCTDEAVMSLACFEHAKTEDNLGSRPIWTIAGKAQEVTSHFMFRQAR
jgi:hypothetical protein